MVDVRNRVRRKFLGLFTSYQYSQLTKNGAPENRGSDHLPVVHLTIGPLHKAQILLTEIYDNGELTAYGLFQHGDKIIEGEVPISKLESMNLNGQDLFNNLGFIAHYPLSTFKKVAEELNIIVANSSGYEDYFEKFSLDQ